MPRPSARLWLLEVGTTYKLGTTCFSLHPNDPLKGEAKTYWVDRRDASKGQTKVSPPPLPAESHRGAVRPIGCKTNDSNQHGVVAISRNRKSFVDTT
jgi:hypothetical protein